MFSPELMKKLTYLLEGELILKYQLIPEELDALVSVKSDEDLRHMLEEYDRHANGGTPRLRVFLFPANPTVIENQNMEPQAIEQRYIDAINGIIRNTTTTLAKATTINTSYPSFSISSPPCSSPRSPESGTNDPFAIAQGGRHQMHRVHSSPSINNLSAHSQSLVNQQQNPHNQHHYYHNYRQPPLLSPLNHHHQYQQQQSYQPTKPPLDPHRGVAPNERLIKVRSVGRSESSRYHVDSVQNNYYLTSKQHRGSMNCNKCIHYDECGGYGDGRIDRSESLPLSPLRQSPHHDYYGAKPWDT